MRDLLNFSVSMEKVVAASALRSFCELAKLDHQIFKFEVYKVLLNLSQKTIHDFAKHSDYRLGKWYYEGGKVGLAFPNCPHIVILKPHM